LGTAEGAAVQFYVTGTFANTGGFSNVTGNNFPTTISAGWYHVNIEIEFETITSDSARFQFYPQFGTSLLHEVTYWVPDLVNGTKSFVISTYMYFTSGDYLFTASVAGSGGSGRFIATIAR